MIIEKHYPFLRVTSGIYFDDSGFFCGRTCLIINACKEDPLDLSSYTIYVGVKDQDDYEFGVVYRPAEDKFIKVLRELINWQRDHEQGTVSAYDFLKKGHDFFPDCGCQKIKV